MFYLLYFKQALNTIHTLWVFIACPAAPIPSDRSADKTILLYGTAERCRTNINWHRLPDSLDEIARALVPGSGSGGICPYTREDLENLIRGVVNYEAEEPDGLGWQNLQAMGFNDEDMLFFGMPPYLEEE